MIAMLRMRQRYLAVILTFPLLASPGMATASDFSFLMWLLLIPCGVFAAIIFLATWLGTKNMEPSWMRTAIRIAAACIVLTPTYTRGGNGQSLSIAAYDIMASAFGADSAYALHALINAAMAALGLLALLWISKHFR